MSQESSPIIIARNAGQGSQYQGMGAEAAGDYRDALDVYGEGSAILKKNNRRLNGASVDLRYLCFEATDEELGQNHATQLSIFATTIAAQKRLRAQHPDLRINKWAGHSIGEYAALVDAGVLSFEYALLLVDERARLMTEAGSMAESSGKKGGIGVVLSENVGLVESIAIRNGCYIANYNSPNQTGISGAQTDLERVEETVVQEGMRYISIPVSVAVHSGYMSYAEEWLRDYISSGSDFKDPEPNTVILNRTGQYAQSGQEIADLAPEQVTNPVMWLPGMKLAIESSGVKLEELEDQPTKVVLLEVGAKSVLSGIDKHFAKANRANVKVVDFQTALRTGLDLDALAA